MERPDPKAVVASGYDTMAARYDEWSKRIVDDPRHRYVPLLLDRLATETPAILEIGCGSGSESSRLLAQRGVLTGTDISEAQVSMAQERLPEAKFIVGDVTQADFAAASFDAIVALYVLTHIPQAELPSLLSRIDEWLRPRGLFLGTFATGADEGFEHDWLGVPMFFSGFDVQTNLRLVSEAGLEVIEASVESMHEPEEGETQFLWVLAQNAA